MDKLRFYVEMLQMHPGSVADRDGNSYESMKFIPDLIPPDKYNKILDVGVANGFETKILKDMGYTPLGIIRGKANIHWAENNYRDVEYICCDMHDLPFSNETFDAIYANQVFEHSYAPMVFLLECYSVLREGGLMYLGVPSFEEREGENDPASLYPNHISHCHPSLFPGNVYKQLFEKSGFKIVWKRNTTEYLLERLAYSSLHSDVSNAIIVREKYQREVKL